MTSTGKVTRIAIAGSGGRMGRMLLEAVAQDGNAALAVLLDVGRMLFNHRLKLGLDGKTVVVKVDDQGHTRWTTGHSCQWTRVNAGHGRAGRRRCWCWGCCRRRCHLRACFILNGNLIELDR